MEGMLPGLWGNNPNGLQGNQEARPIGVNLSTAVILSAAKDLLLGRAQILRCAQYDRWRGWRAFRSYHGKGEDPKEAFVAMHQL